MGYMVFNSVTFWIKVTFPTNLPKSKLWYISFPKQRLISFCLFISSEGLKKVWSVLVALHYKASELNTSLKYKDYPKLKYYCKFGNFRVTLISRIFYF